MSDEDIIASEKYFQEHKVTTGPVAAVALNVNNSVWSSMGVIVIDAIQVYFHVVSRDLTLVGGNIPYVLYSQEK
jgi:hypothetical protein